jgi:hypothetical protein
LQTTLQRCPLNSVEQLGQIEAASLFRFPGARFARTPAGVSSGLGAIAEPDEFPVELTVDLMSGVVAQMQLQENINDP